MWGTAAFLHPGSAVSGDGARLENFWKKGLRELAKLYEIGRNWRMFGEKDFAGSSKVDSPTLGEDRRDWRRIGLSTG